MHAKATLPTTAFCWSMLLGSAFHFRTQRCTFVCGAFGGFQGCLLAFESRLCLSRTMTKVGVLLSSIVCSVRLAMVRKTHKVLLHPINVCIHANTHAVRHHIRHVATTPPMRACHCVVWVLATSSKNKMNMEQCVVDATLVLCKLNVMSCHVMSSNTWLIGE